MVTVSGTVTRASGQSAKASTSMEVRPAGKVTRARAEQRSKAKPPMEVAGKVMVVRAEQRKKAWLPMEVSEAGRKVDGDQREAAFEGAAADGDERGAVEQRPSRQVRHAFGQHRVPIGDDDLPAAHVQRKSRSVGVVV